MEVHTNSTAENKMQQASSADSQAAAGVSGTYLQDNRPQSIVQKQQLNALINKPPPEPPVQKKANSTGLPDTLKSGIENLSGHSMDDVKVHYNSSQPAQLNAHAYAQGTDIHIASGQEKHLPHEAWHVVQQKQGRVKPTVQLKGKVNINDDKGLEKEADVMGAKAAQLKTATHAEKLVQLQHKQPSVIDTIVQRVPVPVGTEGIDFFDGNIPAFLIFSGNAEKEEKKFQKFEIRDTREKVLFEPLTGLYYNAAGTDVIPAHSLVALKEVSTSDTDPQGLHEAKAIVDNLNHSLRLALPIPASLPKTAISGNVIKRLLLKVAIPDLLQLIQEAEQKGDAKADAPVKAMYVLTMLAMQTPVQHASLLQLLSDITVNTSDALIGIISDNTPQALMNVAHQHNIENSEGIAAGGKAVIVNEFGGESEGSALSKVQRVQLIEKAYALGINLTSFLKSAKNKYDHADADHKKVDTVMAELNKEIQKYEKKIEPINKLMTGVDLTAEFFPQIIVAITKKGISLDGLDKALKAIPKKMKYTGAKTLPASVQYVLLHYEAHASPGVVELDPKHFSKEKHYDTDVIDPMLLDSVDRAKMKGHTLPENGYIERHFTPSLMKFLADNPSMYIEIYEGHTSQALGDLANMGYTHIIPFSKNANTDFQQFTATDPRSHKSSFVIVGMPGKAYQREIAAHFMYYNPPINPLRILHHKLKSQDASVDDFMPTLALLPKGDFENVIVQMGNVSQVERLLKAKGIEPLKELSAPNLYGKAYIFNESLMISLKVEPFLYADRSGAFLKAIQKKFGMSKVHVIFTGTAGALDQALQVGDLVAPDEINQADNLHPEKVPVVNHASKLMSTKYPNMQDQGMISGAKHGAVDSILFEDKLWFKEYDSYFTIVEQEVAHLAKAVAEAQHRTKLYVVFRVSDVLGVHDFTEEAIRPEYRTPDDVSQGSLVIDILEKEFGKLEPSVPVPGPVLAKFEKSKEGLILEVEGKIIEISKAVIEMMSMVDPDLAASFMKQLDDVVLATGQLKAAKAATALSKLFQVYDLSMNHLKVITPKVITTFKWMVPPKAPLPKSVEVEINVGGEPPVMISLKGAKNLWLSELDNIPSGTQIVYSLYIDGKVVEDKKDLQTTAGKLTFIK